MNLFIKFVGKQIVTVTELISIQRHKAIRSTDILQMVLNMNGVWIILSGAV